MTRTPERHAPIDLTATTALALEGLRLARGLDQQEPHQGNNPEIAAAKRDLIYLADTLDRAAAEARAAYHVLNGRHDVLERL